MELQELFYWTQSVYAIIGIIVFASVFVFLILIFKKLSRLEEKVERITQKSEAVVDSARNIVVSGEKIVFYGVYKLLKKFGRYRDDY